MTLATGHILRERYRIVSLLGQGGFGAVYRAWDLNLERPVALKENLESSPEAQRQFKLEAKILADLVHPNLPRVTDHFFISDQGQYLVMDYVDGEDLQSILDRERVVPEQQVMAWITQVCEALTYLHRQPLPIIHRDIKPANIKIQPDGRVMLVDFGIAKVYDPQLATTMGAKAITPGFSPPEQYGQGKTDARSDVYSLGATIYSLLTGQQPPDALERMVHDTPLPPIEQFNRQITPQVAQAALKAMEVTTKRRFQNIDEFRAALLKSTTKFDQPSKNETKISRPDGNKPPEPTVPARSQPVQKVWLAGVLGLVLLLVIGVVGIFAFSMGETPPDSGRSVPAVEQVIIELDGEIIDIVDDFQVVACDTSHRLEVKLLNATGELIQPDAFTYTWRFGPGDEQNEDKLASGNYAVSYYVPCDLDYQMVTLEVGKEAQTLYIKSIRFEIRE